MSHLKKHSFVLLIIHDHLHDGARGKLVLGYWG